ncbi:MAG: 4Fe-4S dicluster domain-containing protein [bacterium]
MYEIKIDKEKCTGCGECVDICPSSVLELVDAKCEPTNIDDCVGCESCVETCPDSLIKVTET